MQPSNYQNRPLLKNLNELISHDYCIGCGLCIAMCPDDSARMTLNNFGVYQPEPLGDTCNDCSICTQVCPFSDGLIEGVSNPNENELGANLFGGPNINQDERIGTYIECYAGYAEEYRRESTSGGLITWSLTYLLETGRIDKVVCVGRSDTNEIFYKYKICTTIEEVRSAAKSRYYPVNLAEVLKTINQVEGKYAVVALPCMIKGIRLAQIHSDVLHDRIVFCVGLFCGGLKTTHYTEFLSAQLGVSSDKIANPEYRIKHEGKTSQDYYFGVSDPSGNNEVLEFRVKNLRDLWGPGFFKPNACDYCDDVTSELADLSAGDAWMLPYTEDWHGNNIVITRSKLAQELIQEGKIKGLLSLDRVSSEQVAYSQKTNFAHRRKGLSYRLYWAKDMPVPRKRVLPQRPKNPIEGIIYRLRMRIRAKSQTAWLLQREKTGTQFFDQQIRKDLNSLRRWQFADRIMRKLFRR